MSAKRTIEGLGHAAFWGALGYFTDPGWAALALGLILFFTVREMLWDQEQQRDSQD